MLHTSRYNSSQSTKRPLFARRWLLVVMVIGIVAGGVVYLGLTNDISAKGYEISKLESQVESKRMEAQKLEARVAGLRSQLSPLAPSDGSFIAVERIEYLAAVPLAGVAVK